MKNMYKFTFDTGRVCYAVAKTRTEAIRMYCRESGMTEGWLNAHCTVKNLGRVIE